MSYKVFLTPAFEKEVKKLSKKYPSLKSDLATLLISLTKDPATGKSLGNDCYKIRLAIGSKNKGKSGGARVITYVKVIEGVIYLISIYDKSDTETISDSEILSRVKLYK